MLKFCFSASDFYYVMEVVVYASKNLFSSLGYAVQPRIKRRGNVLKNLWYCRNEFVVFLMLKIKCFVLLFMNLHLIYRNIKEELQMVSLTTPSGRKASGTPIRAKWRCQMLSITANQALRVTNRYRLTGISIRKLRMIRNS